MHNQTYYSKDFLFAIRGNLFYVTRSFQIHVRDYAVENIFEDVFRNGLLLPKTEPLEFLMTLWFEPAFSKHVTNPAINIIPAHLYRGHWLASG